MTSRPLMLLGLLCWSGNLLAHPGAAHAHGFGAGFGHPFMGPDHLLAMLLVAWWAAGQPNAHWWRLPLGFMAGLALGALLPLRIPVESLVTGTVLLLGSLLLLRIRPPRIPMATALAPVLALLLALPHGMAHAGELTGHAWLPGMLLASLLLHLAGAALGLLTRQSDRSWLSVSAGALTIVAGATLLVAG